MCQYGTGRELPTYAMKVSQDLHLGRHCPAWTCAGPRVLWAVMVIPTLCLLTWSKSSPQNASVLQHLFSESEESNWALVTCIRILWIFTVLNVKNTVSLHDENVPNNILLCVILPQQQLQSTMALVWTSAVVIHSLLFQRVQKNTIWHWTQSLDIF